MPTGDGKIIRKRHNVNIDEYLKEKTLAEKHLGITEDVISVTFTIGKHSIEANDQGEFMKIDNKLTSEYSKEELSKIVEDIKAENPRFPRDLILKEHAF